MNKEFIPYEQALELKELGFDEVCLGYHNIDPYLPNPTFNLVRPFEHEWCLPAPLYQQAFRWFREKYEIHFDIRAFVWDFEKQQLAFKISFYINPFDNSTKRENWFGVYLKYEEAELACLKKLIEIVKTK